MGSASSASRTGVEQLSASAVSTNTSCTCVPAAKAVPLTLGTAATTLLSSAPALFVLLAALSVSMATALPLSFWLLHRLGLLPPELTPPILAQRLQEEVNEDKEEEEECDNDEEELVKENSEAGGAETFVCSPNDHAASHSRKLSFGEEEEEEDHEEGSMLCGLSCSNKLRSTQLAPFSSVRRSRHRSASGDKEGGCSTQTQKRSDRVHSTSGRLSATKRQWQKEEDARATHAEEGSVVADGESDVEDADHQPDAENDEDNALRRTAREEALWRLVHKLERRLNAHESHVDGLDRTLRDTLKLVSNTMTVLERLDTPSPTHTPQETPFTLESPYPLLF